MQKINYDLWDFSNIQQQFTSKDTSINSNQMPKTIKKIENLITPGQKWADLGGVVLIMLFNILMIKTVNYLSMIHLIAHKIIIRKL